MKTLLNFSHPLSAGVKAELETWANDTINEIVIPVQINFDQPVQPQLEALATEAMSYPAMNFYIPPALSFAAAYVTTARYEYDSPYMVVLKRTGTPPQFVLAEVVSL